MSDEMAELKRRLEESERSAAIWRSQTMVLLLAFIVGVVGSLVWMRSTLSGRVEKLEARTAKVETDSIKGLKVVEAEAFVVKNTGGKELARLDCPAGKGGVLCLTSPGDSEGSFSASGLFVSDLRPEVQVDVGSNGEKKMASPVIVELAQMEGTDGRTVTLHLQTNGPPGAGVGGHYGVTVKPDGTKEMR